MENSWAWVPQPVWLWHLGHTSSLLGALDSLTQIQHHSVYRRQVHPEFAACITCWVLHQTGGFVVEFLFFFLLIDDWKVLNKITCGKQKNERPVTFYYGSLKSQSVLIHSSVATEHFLSTFC